MDYRENEQGLVQLLKGIEYVPGTFPPVYIHEGILIGYDKLERIKIIAYLKNKTLKLVESIIGANLLDSVNKH